MSDGIILPHGGYKKLLTYQKSDIIFQGTVVFVKRFLVCGDRTIDQMVQAARSGKQNIIEGSEASATSKGTELKLTNVAKASLEELLEDYLDYLKTHNLTEWPKDSEKGLAARKLGREGTWKRSRLILRQRVTRWRRISCSRSSANVHFCCRGKLPILKKISRDTAAFGNGCTRHEVRRGRGLGKGGPFAPCFRKVGRRAGVTLQRDGR